MTAREPAPSRQPSPSFLSDRYRSPLLSIHYLSRGSDRLNRGRSLTSHRLEDKRRHTAPITIQPLFPRRRHGTMDELVL